MLTIKNIKKNFGGLTAINDVSMNISKGSITGLIGPNGAGKTTLFNVIAGSLKSDNGEIFFDNENITGLKAHELFKKKTPAGRELASSSLTTFMNVKQHRPRTWLGRPVAGSRPFPR